MTGNPIKRNLLELNGMLIVRAVARLVAAVLLVDRLGMASYGKMAWALTLTYVSVADDLALGQWAMRSTARDPRWYKESTVGFMTVATGAALLRFGALLVVLPWVCHDAETRRLAVWFSAASLFDAWSLGWLHFLRERMMILRNVAVLREVVWLGGVVTLIHSPADLHRLPALFLLVQALCVAIVNVMAVVHEGFPELRMRIPSFRDLFGGAVPVWIAGRVFHLRAQLGTLVIGEVAGSTAVAVFDLAWRVTYNVWLAGATSLRAVTPALLQRAGESAENFWSLLRRSLRIAYVLALIAPVIAAIALRPVLLLVLGQKGLPVVFPLQLLLVMTIPAILRGPLGSALFALNRNRTLGWLGVLDILTVAVALYAARAGGAIGLAGSLAGIETVLALVTGWALFRSAMAGCLAVAWRAALAAAVAGLATFLAAGLDAVPQVLAGGVVYLGAIWLLEPVSREVLELLRGGNKLPSS